jgi:hypothetical protein
MSKKSLHNSDEAASIYDTMALWILGQSSKQAPPDRPLLDSVKYQ